MTTVPVARLRMSGNIKLPEARVLADQLMDVLKERDVSVDATDLEATDLSVIQVLLAARAYAAGHGRKLEVIHDANGPLGQLMARLGMDGALADDARLNS